MKDVYDFWKRIRFLNDCLINSLKSVLSSEGVDECELKVGVKIVEGNRYVVAVYDNGDGIPWREISRPSKYRPPGSMESRCPPSVLSIYPGTWLK